MIYQGCLNNHITPDFSPFASVGFLCWENAPGKVVCERQIANQHLPSPLGFQTFIPFSFTLKKRSFIWQWHDRCKRQRSLDPVLVHVQNLPKRASLYQAGMWNTQNQTNNDLVCFNIVSYGYFMKYILKYSNKCFKMYHFFVIWFMNTVYPGGALLVKHVVE